MYEEEIHFVKLLLKEPETVLAQLTLVTLSFHPVTPKSKLSTEGGHKKKIAWQSFH